MALAVPLGAFAPTTAAPADAASRSALHGPDLLPSLNVGGYVSQPPQLITTLDALPALENSAYFSDDLHTGDPISVIRVRVAGGSVRLVLEESADGREPGRGPRDS